MHCHDFRALLTIVDQVTGDWRHFDFGFGAYRMTATWEARTQPASLIYVKMKDMRDQHVIFCNKYEKRLTKWQQQRVDNGEDAATSACCMPDRMSFDIKRGSRRILWYLYFIMRKGSTQKACWDLLSSVAQIPVSLPALSPSLSSYPCLSQSAATTPCSSSELWFRRVRYAGAALLTRNAHFNPARHTVRQSDSLTVVNSFATIMIVWLLISSSRSSTGLSQRRLRPLDTCRLVKCWVLNMFPANCSAHNEFCSIYIKESPHSILPVCIARPAVAPSEQQQQPDEEHKEAEHAMICIFFCPVSRLEVFYFFLELTFYLIHDFS